MKTRSKKTKSSAPVCAFCGRSGEGVLFAIFSPRFKPFGTACCDCEASVPADVTTPPAKPLNSES